MGILHFCKDLDCKIENQGEKLVITIKGDKEKLTKLEKKMKLMRELCCGDENWEGGVVR